MTVAYFKSACVSKLEEIKSKRAYYADGCGNHTELKTDAGDDLVIHNEYIVKNACVSMSELEV